ncbi:MAG: ABC transporter ATP-binding protein [Eubacteriales bacterium]|nr:ABC transporter ATP-binding protein [Eubacteriales bacterium]
MNRLTGRTKLLLLAVSVLEIALAAIGALASLEGARVLQAAQLGSWEAAGRALALCLGLVAADAALSLGSAALMQAMTSHSIQDLRSRLLGSMFARPIRAFRERDSGWYMNLLTTDCQTFAGDFLATVPLLVSWAARIIAAAGMLYFLHPLLMAVSLCAAALPLAAQNLFNRLAARAKKAYSAASAAFTAVMKETVEGCEAIRMDGSQGPLTERFLGFSAAERKKRQWVCFVGELSQTFFLASASLVYLAGLGMGGWLAAQGKLDGVLMLAGVNYIVQISNGFGNVISYAIRIRSIRDIRRKLGRESAWTAQSCPPAGGGDLEYRDVGFSFGERQLFAHFSYAFSPGGCYGIVGPSGSGKSTLVKLLLKLHDGYTGHILLGGEDISALTDDAVYARVGVLPQSTCLFNASLYENITMFSGVPAEDSDQYRALLDQVNLTDLARQAGDRPLGEFGDRISGGERQRICLARCLRTRKPVYIFDEPATGLDPENAAIIRRAISRCQATRVVITHDQDPAHLAQFSGVIRLKA